MPRNSFCGIVNIAFGTGESWSGARLVEFPINRTKESNNDARVSKMQPCKMVASRYVSLDEVKFECGNHGQPPLLQHLFYLGPEEALWLFGIESGACYTATARIVGIFDFPLLNDSYS